MRRLAWPLASMLLALSACNALTGASDLSTCSSCDEGPGLDSSVAIDARLPEASASDGSAGDALDAATIDARTDADADAGIGCQGELACTRVVFVTSVAYTGNLGGFAGADAKCQALADQSNIARIRGRTFVAWISTTATSPAARFTHGTQPYMGANGSTIASSWSDLTDGTLQNGIQFDELGGNRNGVGAWTATNSNGAGYSGTACADWTGSLAGAKGDIGNVGGNGGGWSANGPDDCAATHSLYCFER